MAVINKQDTDGTKPLLTTGEFGFDNYIAGGDQGRVYVGDGTANVPLSRKSEVDTHIANTANPHSVTKAQVGLSNVDNTSDINKPVSTAQQTALNGKVSTNGVQALSTVPALDITGTVLTLNKGDGTFETAVIPTSSTPQVINKSTVLKATSSITNTISQAGFETILGISTPTIDNTTQWGDSVNEAYDALVWSKDRNNLESHRLSCGLLGDSYLQSDTTSVPIPTIPAVTADDVSWIFQTTHKTSATDGSTLNDTVTQPSALSTDQLVVTDSTNYPVNQLIMIKKTDANKTWVTSAKVIAIIDATTVQLDTTFSREAVEYNIKEMVTPTNHNKYWECNYNPITGFTMAKYEGSGLAGHEIPHKLGRKLGMFITKPLSTTNDWMVKYDGEDDLKCLLLSSTAADTSYSSINDYSNEQNLVLGSNGVSNSSSTYISYGWANSYYDDAGKLNGNYYTYLDTNQILHLSVHSEISRDEVMWEMTKTTATTGDWNITDFDRGTTKELTANLTAIESTVTSNDNVNTLSPSKFDMPSETSNLQLSDTVVSFSDGIGDNGAVNYVEKITDGTFVPSEGWL